jgi:hypothetical protein
MPRCSFIKGSGERCKGTANGPSGLCWNHDPANAEERSKLASKAGRARPNGEVVGLKAQLQDLTRDVLSGEIETGRAAVANQLINTHLRAIELERKVREQDEVLARIEALEQQQEGAAWG